MSQSDKRVAVFAEKPSPTDIEEMFVLNCSERRPRRSNSLQQRLSVIRERRGRRSLQYNINVCITDVGTRRAVSVVIIKRNRLYQHYRYKQTFP